jgi:hypothetical protein
MFFGLCNKFFLPGNIFGLRLDGAKLLEKKRRVNRRFSPLLTCHRRGGME